MRRLPTPLAAACALALCASAAAAPASAAPCAGADDMPTSSNAAAVRATTLCMLNKQRRAHHLRSLHGNGRLRGAATGYSQLMVRLGFFDHVSPTGSTMMSRIQGSHYLDGARSWSLGENIAWGSGTLATPRSIVRAWMHSPEHRANILNGGFRDIGIGIATGAPIPLGSRLGGATYTTDFGTRG